MFCYVFWEPVLYFDPVASFPKETFLPGRFYIGIAWDHGIYPFTNIRYGLNWKDWTHGWM
jgi:hypothetical protein